ncbi:MAG TPA: response regulator [Candidatus Saccharimonadales bacterium]|nr:response regulator [Candidatus Saccharimonadales bacterium]
MHVLLIEPDKLLAQVYTLALERAGHSVAHARSAQAAVHAADEQLPDVVVLELQLPRHNGIEFLYEFRSYSEWRHIPVLLHTYVRPGELAPAATLHDQLGVLATLYKPATNLEQLCMAVAQLGLPAAPAEVSA